MNRSRGIGLLVILFSLFLVLICGEAQEKSRGGGKGGEKALKTGKGFGFTASRAPIDITSDTVEANQKTNTALITSSMGRKPDS